MQTNLQLATHSEIQNAVLEAIRTANGLFLKSHPIAPDMNSTLLGADGALDSLALVNLFVLMEDAVSQATGKPIPLLENALSLGGGGITISVSDMCAMASQLADQV